MPRLTRRLFIVLPLLAVLAVVAVLLLTRTADLRFRAARIAVGMSRGEVEGTLGRPDLTIGRTGDRGTLSAWVDQLWQVDVLFDTYGRVESVGCKPSDSFLRRTVGRVITLPEEV